MMDAKRHSVWWHEGNFAPVTQEIEAFDLEVDGALPKELVGTYMRNGPNPKGVIDMYVAGDGMLHGVRVAAGKVSWYRNRFVRTARFEVGGQIAPEHMLDRRFSVANTNVVRHAGKIMALEELHFPYLIGRDLETVGWTDFAGKLPGTFTAHPKICPVTGEMLAFGYNIQRPFMTYYRFDASGALVQSQEIPAAYPTVVHDFGVTRSRVVFMDLPFVFDLEAAMRGEPASRLRHDYPARLGVMPRNGSAADLRWCEIPPCYVFHPLNVYDDGRKIVMDVVRYADYRFGNTLGERLGDCPGFLTRWVIDADAGRVSQEQLDDTSIEFPRVSDAKVGSKHRYGYGIGMAQPHAPMPGTSGVVIKYDLQTGAVTRYDFGAACHVSEFVHVAAGGAEEDAGWLMGLVHDDATNKSSFAVMDATQVAKGPIARVELPQRVPYGFHGNWFGDEA